MATGVVNDGRIPRRRFGVLRVFDSAVVVPKTTVSISNFLLLVTRLSYTFFIIIVGVGRASLSTRARLDAIAAIAVAAAAALLGVSFSPATGPKCEVKITEDNISGYAHVTGIGGPLIGTLSEPMRKLVQCNVRYCTIYRLSFTLQSKALRSHRSGDCTTSKNNTYGGMISFGQRNTGCRSSFD